MWTWNGVSVRICILVCAGLMGRLETPCQVLPPSGDGMNEVTRENYPPSHINVRHWRTGKRGNLWASLDLTFILFGYLFSVMSLMMDIIIWRDSFRIPQVVLFYVYVIILLVSIEWQWYITYFTEIHNDSNEMFTRKCM